MSKLWSVLRSAGHVGGKRGGTQTRLPEMPGSKRRAGVHQRRAGLRAGRKHTADFFRGRLLRPGATLLSSMASSPDIVTVTVLAAPSTPCSGKMTWETATDFLRDRLNRRFGAQVAVNYVELFSAESFAFPDVLEAIQQEKYRLPIVFVDGSVVSDGTKINEGLIARHVREYLQKNHP